MKRFSRDEALTTLEKVAGPSLHGLQATTTSSSPGSWTQMRANGHSDSDRFMALDMMTSQDSLLGLPGDVGARGQDPLHAKIPNGTGFEYNLNGDVSFDALFASASRSPVLENLPGEHIEPARSNITDASMQSPHEFFAAMSDQLMGPLGPLGPASSHRSKRKDSPTRCRSMGACPDRTRSCIISVLKILRALHMPPAECLSSVDGGSDSCFPQPRRTDSIFLANRESIRLVSDILECPCSLNPQVQLPLTIICWKLTAWYGAMIPNSPDSTDDSSDSSSMMRFSAGNNNARARNAVSGANQDPFTKWVQHQPINIGEFSFDNTLDGKLRAHLVFSELPHIETLIKNLAKRVDDTLRDGGVEVTARGERTAKAAKLGSTAKGRHEEAIGHSSIQLLRKQLETLKAEMSVILTPGNGSTDGSGHNSASGSGRSRN